MNRTGGGSRLTWWLLLAGPAAIALAASATVIWMNEPSFFDLSVYRLGAAEVLHGTGQLYDFRVGIYPFTYPPAAALALSPVALLPIGVLEALWTVLQVLCLVAVWKLVIRAARPAGGIPRQADPALIVAAVAVSAALAEPVMQSLRLGQVNLLLLLVVLVDLVGPVNHRRRGYLTGLAAAFKLTPLVFLALLLVTRQWRALRNALIAFGGAAAVGFVLMPKESVHFWTDLVLHSSRIGPVERGNNQSVMGLLLRLGAPSGATGTTLAWLLVAGAFGAVALVLAARCWRRGEHLLAVSLTGIIGVVASPVSWSHHWVWCIPVGLGLVSLTRRPGGQALSGWIAAGLWWAIFVIAPQVYLPTGHGVELTWTPLQQVIGSTYLWGSVLLLAYVAYQLRSHPARVAAPSEASAVRLH